MSHVVDCFRRARHRGGTQPKGHVRPSLTFLFFIEAGAMLPGAVVDCMGEAVWGYMYDTYNRTRLSLGNATI